MSDELNSASPDDIRAQGFSVAVHNDYRLDGVPHTFWLFVRGHYAVKGEGRTDREALNEVRRQLLTVSAETSAERRMREALKPFADMADVIESGPAGLEKPPGPPSYPVPDHLTVLSRAKEMTVYGTAYQTIRMSHLRAARSALAPQEGKK